MAAKPVVGDLRIVLHDILTSGDLIDDRVKVKREDLSDHLVFEDDMADEDYGPPAKKKRRGRPKGSTKVTKAKKRKRGRPRKDDVEEEGKEVAIPGQRRLIMSQFKCFICETQKINEVYDDMKQLAEHVMMSHTEVSVNGSHVLHCVFCSRSFSFTKDHFRWHDMADTLSHYYPHLHDVHGTDFMRPEYVLRVDCPHDGCDHVQFSIYQMRLHLRRKHKIVVTSLQMAQEMFAEVIDVSDLVEDGKTENYTPKEIVIAGQRRPRFSRYECFLCQFDSTEFLTEKQFALHIKNKHLVQTSTDRYLLKCLHCAKNYVFTRKHVNWVTFCETFGALLTHLKIKHSDSFNVPSYISPVECPQPGCRHAEFTVYLMRRHLRNKHKIWITDWKTAKSLFPWITEGKEQELWDQSDSEWMELEEESSQMDSVDGYTKVLMGRLPMSKFDCFICDNSDGTSCSSEDEFQEHIQDFHVLHTQDGQGFLKCRECDQAFLVGDNVLDILPIYASHLLEAHSDSFTLPPTISLIGCSEENCEATFFCLADMKTHLQEAHSVLMSDRRAVQALFPVTIEGTKQVQSVLQEAENTKPIKQDLDVAMELASITDLPYESFLACHKPLYLRGQRKLLTSSHNCFLCDMTANTVVHSTGADLFQHIRQMHVKQESEEDFSLACVLCDKMYAMKKHHTAAVADTMCRLFTHIMYNHPEVEKPDYITSITCPLQECNHTSYSIMAIVDHLKDDHSAAITSTDILVKIFPFLEGYINDTHATDTDKRAPGRRKLILSQNKCVLCCDEFTFDSEQDLANHIKDSHLTQECSHFVLGCSFCTKKYILKPSSVRWNVICDTLARYLSHLVENHKEFNIPDFVEIFNCSECERTDLFNLHSFSNHLTTDHNVTLSDHDILKTHFPPSFAQLLHPDSVVLDTEDDNRKGCRFMGHRRLVMMKYACFICQANSEEPLVFEGELQLANHVKESHLVKKAAFVHALQCMFCSKEYLFQTVSVICCDLCEMLVRYLQHLHLEHGYVIPEWIESFPCSECDAVMLSLFSVRKHLRVVHSIALSDNNALSAYPFLSALDPTTKNNNAIAKRNYFGSKDVDVWKRPEPLPLFAFEAFSSGVNADSVPEMVALKEFDLTLTENCQNLCPFCEESGFGDIHQMLEHWISNHFTRDANNYATLTCKFCSFKISCSKHVLSPDFASKSMASYLHHLVSNHRESEHVVIPAYVIHSVCPFSGCSQLFFNLHSMKLHLKAHSVITDDLKSFVIPVELGVEHKLQQYNCFLCAKNEDHLTALSFVNHCIEEHLQKNESGYLVDCEDCPQSSLLLLQGQLLTASKVMTLVISHAEHLISEHDVHIEGLVPMYNPREKGKTMFEHHAVSQPVTITTKRKCINNKLFMTEMRCLLCSTETEEFANVNAMLTHYTDKHLQGTQLKCTHCSQHWLLGSDATVLKVLPLVAGHVHCRHPTLIDLLQYTQQYKCSLTACNHVSFTTLAEKKHFQSHHLQLSSDILSPDMWTLPLVSTQAVLDRYFCFQCTDQKDLGSLLAFVNHWMTVHCSVNDKMHSFKWQHCNSVYKLATEDKRWVKNLMCLIGEYLLHLTIAHGFKRPDYVLHIPGQSQLSTAVTKPQTRIESLLTYQDMHDSQVSFMQLECFQCENIVTFLSLNNLYEHWLQQHFTSVKKKRSAIKCRFCSNTFQPRRFPVPALAGFLECLSFYALHLSTEHNYFPACLMSAPCPVYACNFKTFSMHRLRQHLRQHDIGYALEAEIRSGDVELPSKPTHAIFNSFSCFLCTHQPFDSPLFLVNHFLQKHYTMFDDEIVLSCPRCSYELIITGVVCVPTVWDHICSMLTHLVSEHVFMVPDHIQSHVCTRDKCNHVALTKLDSEKHSLLHSGSLAGQVKFDEWYELQYIRLQCFACGNGEIFTDSEDLALHWLKEHMYTAADGAFVIECSACELKFNKKSSEKFVRMIQRLVADYLQHLCDCHQFTAPEFISLFVCDHEKCSFSSYIPERLVDHEIEFHMESVQDKPDQVILNDDKVSSRKDHPLYHRKPFEVTFTQHLCFLCDDEVDHQSLCTLNEHMQSAHGTPAPRGFATKCSFCARKYSSDNRRRTATTVFGHMLCHMVDAHSFPAPSYVDRLTCTQPSCQYFTFTVDHLSTHLKSFHGIIDVGLSRGKKKTFFQRRQSSKNLTCKMIIRLREFRCFACDDDPLISSSIQEYARHFLNEHMTPSAGSLELRCRYCSHSYSFPAEKRNETSLIMIRVSFLFAHMINNHRMPVPEYVTPYTCEIPGCSHVTYTLNHLETHCQVAHNLSAEEMVLNTEEISTTMIIIDDSVNNIQDFLPTQAELVNMPAGSHTLVSQKEDGSPLQTVVDIQHQVASTYRCLSCGKEFDTVVARKQHIKEAHDQPKNHLCYVCSSSFTSKRALDSHLLRVHQISNKGRKAFACTLCDFKTLLKGKLDRHCWVTHQQNDDS